MSGATNAPTIADAKKVVKVIKKAKHTEVRLRFPRITGPVVMIAYCDAAWGNLSDGKTGGGIFVCLAAADPYGGNELFCPVGWSSKRLQRVVRYTFAGETLIASEALDELLYLADTWQNSAAAKSTGSSGRTRRASRTTYSLKGPARRRG